MKIINWIKKDPLVHTIFLIISPFAVLLFILIVLFIYFFVKIFDPNYEEFGPQVALYQAKDCAHIDQRWSTSNSCQINHWLEGMYKNNPPTLNQLVERAANAKKDLFHRLPELTGYPTKADGWRCSVEGKIILNITTEITNGSVLYKCWPKLN